LISFIKHNGQFVSALPLKSSLPDPDDGPFLEVAIAGNVRSLITGNIAHYPSSHREGINIFPPLSFLNIIEKKMKPQNKMMEQMPKAGAFWKSKAFMSFC